MRFLFPIIFLLIFISCTDDSIFIHYQVDKTCITRVIKGSDNYLYYGRYLRTDILPKDYYIGKFRGGLDADFSAYLFFVNDTVELIYNSGPIEKVGIDHRFYMRFDYDIKTKFDTALYKTSSPFTNCAFSLMDAKPYDSNTYFHCNLTGTTIDKKVLDRFIDSIHVRSNFKNHRVGDVFYDKSVAAYNIIENDNCDANSLKEGTFGNVVCINQNIESEIDVNQINDSKVMVTYDNNLKERKNN